MKVNTIYNFFIKVIILLIRQIKIKQPEVMWIRFPQENLFLPQSFMTVFFWEFVILSGDMHGGV